MTYYSYLCAKESTGENLILRQMGMIPTQVTLWMEIYAFHLENPRLSQFEVALRMRTNKIAVWRAYRFMSTVIL